MTSFPFRHACAPFALAYLFRESYDQVCRRIAKAGANYRSVPTDTMQRVLGTRFAIKTIHRYDEPHQRPQFPMWRKGKRGLWIAIVTLNGIAGHCIFLRGATARDNGWSVCTGPDRLNVVCAWQVEEAA